MKLSEVKSFSGTVWFLLLGSMLSKASYFISMPYLALRVKTVLNLNPFVIGLTLGIGPFVGILAGFYIGYLSDKIGRKGIFVLSILLWSLTFLGFAFATRFWQFALLNTLNGLSNSANQPVSSALLSDLTKSEQRKTVFHFRYFLINIGASSGPLIGAWILLRSPSLGFIVTGIVYLLYGILSVFLLSAGDERTLGGSKATFSETIKTLAGDRPLFFYTIAFILMGLTYSQLDSTLPQWLQALYGKDGVKLFGWLMAINAMTVVVSQIPLTRVTANLGILSTLKVGSFLYGIGLALIGFAGGKTSFILAMIILTWGEVLIFSNTNVLVDQIAPEDKKGTYFAASGLFALGPTVGPALGGFILMRAGGSALFCILGIIGISMTLVYRLGAKSSEKTIRGVGL